MLRKDIRRGRVEQVAQQLKHPYQITGKVITGRQLGRTIGFPTLNIRYGRQLLPKKGVYSVLVYLDGAVYPAMANIGNNPTVSNQNRTSLEVHVFDFDEDVYGRQVSVNFLNFIRPEKRFASLKQLQDQLKRDKQQIQESFKKGV